MCRYFAGFFFDHPLLEPYDYVWRLEPGTRLLCDVPYDVFDYMQSHNKSYAFTLTMFEYENTIPSLWHHVSEYRRTHAYNGDLVDLVQNDDPQKSYNLCHFWSNFEIVKLDMFRSQEYRQFFRYLDETGGFFYERWGDAPIHTLFVLLYLNRSDVVWLDDIGYYHSPYLQCPLDKKTWVDNRCVCDPAEDFSFGFQSCTSHFMRYVTRHSEDAEDLEGCRLALENCKVG